MDFQRLLRLHTILPLRAGLVFSFTDTVARCLNDFQTIFESERADQLFRLSITPATWSLNSMLHHYFPEIPASKLYVSDIPVEGEFVYAYNADNTGNLVLTVPDLPNDVVVWDIEQAEGISAGLYICIGSEYYSPEQRRFEIESRINTFKLAGMRVRWKEI